MLPAIAAMLALLSADSPILLNGHVVKVTGVGDRNHPPAGTASACVDLIPKPACFVAPEEYSYNAKAKIIQLTAGEQAIFFSAESYGISGYRIILAFLRLNRENELENLLPSDTIVSNQARFAIWEQKSVAKSKFFVTANYVWGPGESHQDLHRFTISTFRRKEETVFPDDTSDSYYLYDQYMTARKYDHAADILAIEKREILARLAQIRHTELKAK
jgi:hypothetical protein